ncbi:MAG: peptidoglycan-binding protein [Deltaproteobacteria bacterium]|nr:peptidoglycan-binding protein [Deltaproteobacteria bacterium]
MPAPALKKGNRGAAVRLLKQWLGRLLAPSVELKSDDVFDAQTEEAVRQVQRTALLSPADGVVGAKTWGAIGTLLGQRSQAMGPGMDLLVGPLNIDQPRFFALYVEQFGLPTQSQYQGLSQLLGFMDRDPELSDLRWAAYMLATTYHETAQTWQPIEEHGKGKGHTYGAAVKVTGSDGKVYEHAYYGRGYVQLTWKDNYDKMSRALGLGDELVIRPERVMEPEIAYRIMSYGMRNGSFTGKKLSDYIDGATCDYYNARRIINALDRAGLIKGYALQFETILRGSHMMTVINVGLMA